MAQPNIQELAGGLRTVSREVERFENTPALGGMDAVNARLDRLLQQLHLLQDTMQGMNQCLDLIQMKIYNHSQGDDGVLDGRDGRIPNELPNTLNALRAANRNQCNVLARHLDIPFPHHMTVKERRQQIANFLGVHL